MIPVLEYLYAIHSTGQGGVSAALVTTGIPKVIEQGMKSLGHAGTMVVVGFDRSEQAIAIDLLAFSRRMQ